MKKKLLSILLVLSLMLALVPAAFAVEPASGTCGAEGDGSNVTWTIDKNGVLTVTGTGAITSDAMQIRQLRNRSDVTSAVILSLIHISCRRTACASACCTPAAGRPCCP